MFTEIFEPKESKLTIEIPQEFIGERIIVEVKKVEESKQDKLRRLEKSLEGYRVDLSDYKFNRDQANEYD